jgi:hypothetical protein
LSSFLFSSDRNFLGNYCRFTLTAVDRAAETLGDRNTLQYIQYATAVQGWSFIKSTD